MIRLLLILLVIAGTLYLLVFRQGEEGGHELRQYEESVEKIESMEQQMLQNARERMQKADEMSK